MLAYGNGDAAGAGLHLTWLDRQGKATGTIGPQAQYRSFNLAPDETRVAVRRQDGDGGDIWLTDVSRDTASRFTFDATQDNTSPAWSSDGSRIAFSSVRDGKPGIYVKPSNGAGQEERLFETGNARNLMVLGWTPGDRSILFGMGGLKTARDLWLLSMDGERKTIPLLQTGFGEWAGQISPDGQWLAYTSNETGRSEVYVRAIADSGKWPISSDGGTSPRWRGDGRELFYNSAGNLMALEVRTKGTAFVPGATSALFEFVNVSPGDFSYAVSRDGQRFLAARRGSGEREVAPSPIVVVFNWLDGATR